MHNLSGVRFYYKDLSFSFEWVMVFKFSFFLSLADVGYSTRPLTWKPISGLHVGDPHIDDHVESRALT